LWFFCFKPFNFTHNVCANQKESALPLLALLRHVGGLKLFVVKRVARARAPAFVFRPSRRSE
jgi:hypothetical protein